MLASNHHPSHQQLDSIQNQSEGVHHIDKTGRKPQMNLCVASVIFFFFLLTEINLFHQEGTFCDFLYWKNQHSCFYFKAQLSFEALSFLALTQTLNAVQSNLSGVLRTIQDHSSTVLQRQHKSAQSQSAAVGKNNLSTI